MPTSPPRKAHHRLVRQLRATYSSIVTWDESLRQAASVLRTGDSRGGASNADALLSIVQNAKKALTLRLAELGVEDVSPNSLPDFDQDRPGMAPTAAKISGDRLCLAACQACGSALGAAFREAQASADAVSARVLYGSLREFEKQLWVLNPCQAA